MIGGLPDWQRLWCVMRQEHIRCWNYPEDVGRKMPVHSIDLTEVSELHTHTHTHMHARTRTHTHTHTLFIVTKIGRFYLHIDLHVHVCMSHRSILGGFLLMYTCSYEIRQEWCFDLVRITSTFVLWGTPCTLPIQSMEVENAPRLSIRRPNTLIVRDGKRQSETFLAFESREEKDQWMDTIDQVSLGQGGQSNGKYTQHVCRSGWEGSNTYLCPRVRVKLLWWVLAILVTGE